MFGFIKKYTYGVALVSVFIAAFVVRTARLNSIPVGMTDDEVRVVYSAYSVWKTGYGVTGKIFHPFSFVLQNFSFTPVSIYITAPFVGLLGLSPLAARLPFALAGVGIVVLTFFLATRLFGNRMIALIGAWCTTWNVWAIQLSRMAYEAVFAQFFYLWGTYVFLGDWKKHAVRSLCGSMVLFFLAFNSYNATKVLFLPVLFVLVLLRRGDFRKKWNRIAILLGSVAATLGIFLYFSVVQGASAHGGLVTIFQDSASAAQAVELSRRASSAPGLLLILYHNKVTYFSDQVLRHYLYAFSQDFLFLNQEASGIYSLWSRGNLYLIELPFLLVGIGALWTYKRRVFPLIIAMLLIGPLPSAIGPIPLTYATRSAFMLPWLMLVTAAGLYYSVGAIRHRFAKFMTVGCVALFYTLAIIGYLRQYYFEWPRYSAQSYAQDIRQVVEFIQSHRSSADHFLIANTGDTFFLQYAFYTQMDPRVLQKAYKTTPVLTSLDAIEVAATCMPAQGKDPRTLIDRRTVYIARADCYLQKPDEVIYLPDGTPQWAMYRGTR